MARKPNSHEAGMRYLRANKIVTAAGKTHITYLENDLDVKIGSYDHKSDQWITPVKIGGAYDDHGGASLMIDKKGYLHSLFSGHQPSGYIKYSSSLNPWNSTTWSSTSNVGSNSPTYPISAVDQNGTIHLFYRNHLNVSSPNETRNLIYQYKTSGGPWSSPEILASMTSGAIPTGYVNYYHSITISDDGVLHLLVSFYFKNETNCYIGQKSRHLSYLKKPLLNNGTWTYGTGGWKNKYGTSLTLPITTDSGGHNVYSVSSTSQISLEPSNIVLDQNNEPWFVLKETVHNVDSNNCTIAHPVNSTAQYLYHLKGTTWERTNILSLAPATVTEIDTQTPMPISISAENTIYITGRINGGVGLLYAENLGSTGNNYKFLEIEAESTSNPKYYHVNIERPTNQGKIGLPWIGYDWCYTSGAPDCHAHAVELKR